MKIEVSNGEIIDKLTIIEIKLQMIKDIDKLTNLRKEYDVLVEASEDIITIIDEQYRDLFRINTQLWQIEEDIRQYEKNAQFGVGFVKTARSVYFLNDQRSEVKRKINLITGSNLIEEKSYAKV